MNRRRLAPLLILGISSLIVGCGDDPAVPATPVAEEPNKGIQYLGVDGVLTSDPAAVDCPDDPRNPGRVAFKEMKDFSFYKDREGMEPLAEGCIYSYEGFEGDPFYFPDFVTSVWLKFELTSGPAGCEAFHFVTLRPPHGDGDVKHMHMRFGDTKTSLDGLLQMSLGKYDDADVCNPWWSVYCSEGNEACDQ